MLRGCVLYFFSLRDWSLFMAWGGPEDFGGDHLIVRRTKGGSVVAENPTGGITENFGRIQWGATQICLENEDMVGGSRKSSNVNRGITSVK